jgi:hypothetical protein
MNISFIRRFGPPRFSHPQVIVCHTGKILSFYFQPVAGIEPWTTRVVVLGVLE